MKKLLLFSLLPSFLFAKINGTLEIKSENFKTTYKNREIEGSVDFNTHNNTKLSAELNSMNRMITVGASANLKDFKNFHNQKIWTNIHFKPINDYNLSLKASYENLPLYGFVEVESDLSNYSNKVEYGINSNLKFKVDKYPTPALTLKGFVQKDTVFFKDLRLELEGQHRLNSINGNLAESVFSNGNIKTLGLQYLSAEISGRHDFSKNTQFYFESNIAYRFDNNTSKYGKDVQISRNSLSENEEGHDHNHDHNHNHSHSESHHENEDNFERGFNHIHGYKEANTGLEAKLDRENFSESISDYYLIALKHKYKNLELFGKYKLYHRFRYNEILPNDDIPDIPETTHTFTNYLGLKLKYTGIKNLTLENKTEGYYLFQNNSTIKNYTFENNSKFKYDFNINDKLTLSPGLDTSLTIDGSEYFSEELKENGINAGIYRDFTNSASILPSITANYKVNKNLSLKGFASVNFNFAGVWPKIYNPKFLAVDAIIANLAERNGYSPQSNNFSEFLNKLEKNQINISDENEFNIVNNIYKEMMLEDLTKENSGNGLLSTYKALFYEKEINDPKYFGKILPLKLNDINFKLGLQLKYTW